MEVHFTCDLYGLQYYRKMTNSYCYYYEVLCFGVSKIPLLKKGSNPQSICLLRYKFLDG